LSPTSPNPTQFGRIQDPAGQRFYGFPALAVNKNNDMLISYSRWSSQLYASAAYSFRAGTDPINTLRTEATLRAGSAPYNKKFSGSRNRWGDYSNAQVDPVNDLDIWAIQEFASVASGGYDRWGTWWIRIALGPATPVPYVQLGTITATDTNASDPDVLVEPGESGKLTIQLKNTGTGAATAVSGKLATTTPGVTITTNTSAYPNLAASTGVGNNTTPFAYTLASTVPCGTLVSFTLTVTYSGGPGSPKAFSFKVPSGKANTPFTVTRTGTAVAIPDNNTTGVNILLSVSQVGRIADINFKFGGTACSTVDGATTVGLDHTWVGDLIVTWKAPQGTIVTLMSQPGGAGNSGTNFCNTTLDDESAGASIQNVTSAQNPYTASYKPNSPLSAFDGQISNGTWTLNVSDRASQDTGSVRTFSLIITTYSCSTTALATPFEGQGSDSVLASLGTGGDSAAAPFTSMASLTPRPQAFTGQCAEQESVATGFAVGPQASLTRRDDRPAPLTGDCPRQGRTEGGVMWNSAFIMKQYGELFRLLTG